MIKTLGGDWGSYLSWNKAIQFNFPLMIEKLNLGFMVYRGCQEQFGPNGNYSALANLDASRKAGIPINACYYWHYPDGSQPYYLSLYKAAIEKENPDFIGVDIEQTSILVNGSYQKIDAQKMSDTAQQLCEGLVTLFPEKRVVPYTRQDIISYYSPQMKNWIRKFDSSSWVAGWPDYGEKSYELSWDQIAQLKMKSAYDESIIDVDDFDPPVLLGQTNTKIWQYSSRIKPPVQGFPYDHQYDWNIFYGSLQDMKDWTKMGTISSIVVPPYTATVSSSYLTVLKDPALGSLAIRWIKLGDMVSVSKEENGFGFIGDGWVAVSYLGNKTSVSNPPPPPPSPSVLTLESLDARVKVLEKLILK